GTYDNNLDCNTSTAPSGGDGHDVGYTVETDIWYHFCPGVTGTWTLTITPSNCTGSGFQYSVFQGTPTDLHTRFATFGGPNPSKGYTSTQTYNINVTSTTDCVYIQIDGYAGAICDFGVSLTTTTCTLLSNKLITLSGKVNAKDNKITWSSEDESLTRFYQIERSRDSYDWETISTIVPNGNNSYTYTDKNANGLYYYKVSSIDFNNEIQDSRIIALNNTKKTTAKTTKIFDVMGKEYTQDNLPSGLII
ncbi:MAG: hypothetical protein ACLGGV_10300, partial [Bacteroidia bacterium]